MIHEDLCCHRRVRSLERLWVAIRNRWRTRCSRLACRRMFDSRALTCSELVSAVPSSSCILLFTVDLVESAWLVAIGVVTPPSCGVRVELVSP